MKQKDKERPELFDFPLDPTPSLKAYSQFIKHVDEYLTRFHYYDGVLSIGPIKLGTPDRPCITAPIEMEPGKIEHHLRPTIDILTRAINEAQESISWTKKILKQTGSRSPEAENRIQKMEEIVNVIQELLNEHKGIAWHPSCYIRIRELVESSFKPGEPGIPIQITILV